jgi:hypothetical protein
VNRTQALVLGFFVAIWVSLVAILVSAPAVYDQVLRSSSRNRLAEVAFLVAISVLSRFWRLGWFAAGAGRSG